MTQLVSIASAMRPRLMQAALKPGANTALLPSAAVPASGVLAVLEATSVEAPVGARSVALPELSPCGATALEPPPPVVDVASDVLLLLLTGDGAAPATLAPAELGMAAAEGALAALEVVEEPARVQTMPAMLPCREQALPQLTA